MRERTYVVLCEVQADTRLGDLVFVYLGTFDGKTARDARRSARGYHDLPGTQELVTVPASMWKAAPR